MFRAWARRCRCSRTRGPPAGCSAGRLRVPQRAAWPSGRGGTQPSPASAAAQRVRRSASSAQSASSSGRARPTARRERHTRTLGSAPDHRDSVLDEDEAEGSPGPTTPGSPQDQSWSSRPGRWRRIRRHPHGHAALRRAHHCRAGRLGNRSAGLQGRLRTSRRQRLGRNPGACFALPRCTQHHRRADVDPRCIKARRWIGRLTPHGRRGVAIRSASAATAGSASEARARPGTRTTHRAG